MNREKSHRAAVAAERVLVGGVNSPVRSCAAVGGEPICIARGQGAYVEDIDGNRYLDYVCSYGATLLGHAHPEVVACVARVAHDGMTFGAPTVRETQLAEKIQTALPSMQKLRLVNSGTEACMTALRLARAYTGRNKVIKFSGCYHGHADMLLVQAGSGALTHGMASSAGVPAAVVQDTLVVPYNDRAALEQVLAQHEGEVAALIIEPIVGNCGFIRPRDGYLAAVRELCSQHGALLIGDEVMTGFRVTWGGVQTLSGVIPDLTVLGKVIGGGLPLAALGGREEIMQMLAPSGKVYQAGTLSGNPLAVACGLKTLEILERTRPYTQLGALTRRLTQGAMMLAQEYGVSLTADAEGGMFGLFFTPEQVYDSRQAQAGDHQLFRRFFHTMLERGVSFPPSPFEAGFISTAHREMDIDNTLQKFELFLKMLAETQ